MKNDKQIKAEMEYMWEQHKKNNEQLFRYIILDRISILKWVLEE